MSWEAQTDTGTRQGQDSRACASSTNRGGCCGKDRCRGKKPWPLCVCLLYLYSILSTDADADADTDTDTEYRY